MNQEIRILIVEDNPDDAELIVLELETVGYQISYQQVDNAQAMKAVISSQAWDVIITDYSMPSFSAFSALDIVKSFNLDIPFIVVSGSIGEETAVELMRNGAHDYLLKNNLTRLAPVIERELREAKIRYERKSAIEKVEFLAYYDELTKLPNRYAFLQNLQTYINHSHKFTVVFIEVEQYRQIKYGFGHIKSESLIFNVAKRLQFNLHPSDFLARIGKDEFAVIITHTDNHNDIQTIAAEINSIIDPPFDLEGLMMYASVTIGLVDYSFNFQDAEEFLRAAEIANHNAKVQGLKNLAVCYHQQMQSQATDHLHLETELRQAIKNQELKLFYQPIVELESLRVVGFEALIRWYQPQKGFISPDKFIPLAEKTGLIIPLGELILETAFQQMIKWQEELDEYLPLSLAVNLSSVQLEESNIVPQIINKYQSLDLKGVTLKLEVTESHLMDNIHNVVQCLQKFRSADIQISIDDFGTGYSSLSYLKNLPVDLIKVDRAFVSMIEQKKDFGIMQAIMTLAKTLHLDVVAEGIETTEQMQLLQYLGCQYGQGFLFSPAIPADKVPNVLAKINQKPINYCNNKSIFANSFLTRTM
ncbi:MAG: GGDEF domain-containing response regulator [Nostocales cyanobacterium]|nr:MAG: GGDEF domain-containing response regulator [Nostocales cyanobacterium]